MGDEMQRVERGQLWVMRVQAVIPALILLGVARFVEWRLHEEIGLPWGAIVWPLLVLAILIVIVAPVRRYKALGYKLDDQELQVARGVLVKTETVVPLNRVQHIDVSQGPVERAFKVSRLVLHTAGTMNSLVVLPGLARETAEAMRDSIRARIRQGEL